MSDRAMPAPADLTARQKLLWGMYDFSVGQGLEIGPLHQCIAPRTHCDVKYVDVFDRATLQANWSHDPAVPPEQIPEIDYVLQSGEHIRSIPEAIGKDVRFDWSMASHVIEHVPDVIGWLDQIAQVVKDGGDLVLAIPDRRYCFDLHRPGTTTGQMIQAHELGDTVPSVRAVFDYSRGHASVRAPMIWAGDPVGYENRIYGLETVLERTEQARSGVYIDSHVWLFTPGTFLEQLLELRAVGLSEWKVSWVSPTRPGELEFYAVLTRLPRDRAGWTSEVLSGEPVPGRMPDWLQEATDLRKGLERQVAELRRLAAEGKTAARKQQRELERLRARERRRLSSRLKALIRRSPGGVGLVNGYRNVRHKARGLVERGRSAR